MVTLAQRTEKKNVGHVDSEKKNQAEATSTEALTCYHVQNT